MPTPDVSPVCLECKERFADSRGLCRRCYARLWLATVKGETTWAELEKAGRALPKAEQPRWGGKPK